MPGGALTTVLQDVLEHRLGFARVYGEPLFDHKRVIVFTAAFCRVFCGD